MPIVSRLVKGVSSTIGLATEAVASHKEGKATKERGVSPNPQTQIEAGEGSRSTGAPPQYIDNGRGYPSDEKRHGDEEDDEDDSEDDLGTDRAEWALDDAAEELAPPTYDEASTGTPASAEEVANAFVRSHHLAPTPSQNFQPLPCPVILPQRRPKDKMRGFVRAYAPVLGECSGIDQQTFLDFLKEFDRSSRASPVFDVINIAAMAVGNVPSGIAIGVSIAVQVISRTGQELQSRHRRNTYLDQINETLFKPRGLYCMIMTFKPESNQQVMSMDVNTGASATDQALAKAMSNPDSSMSQKMKKLRLTSGTATGEWSLPESAPLVYPALDAAAVAAADGTPVPAKKQSALKSSSKFIADYMDRRAQATYAGMNPDSQLAAAAPPPQKQFASRFSDPNHPVNSGSIVSLLTGGHVDPRKGLRAKRAQRKASRRGQNLTEQEIKDAQMGRSNKKRGLIGRVLQQDVLYLTIVNMPSESEMREIMQELERTKNQKQQSNY
ncbi:hypothetical protein PV11_04402 [Exophiala sideris]|uniref:Uncharacterized protein n=1 Tax=Exophiala sideris TaxID=1016849 RepID=A0A0D1X3W0_9EURO|nr:hypothetical protein PV11_04402 [Exophiala sideris]